MTSSVPSPPDRGGESRFWQMLPEDPFGHRCGCSFVVASSPRRVSRLDDMYWAIVGWIHDR
ncbi:hypothetical protein [Nocardia sp. N2S4-5]|uniref:hypothetical protein n=1 Tax=Nocardia sp. N2S4-5 TaxID=3351565 RepID=UPI0037D59B4A